MYGLRKNNSALFLRGKERYFTEDDDLQYYLLHQTINKALEIKLKKSHLKGYLDLSNIGLDSIPEKIFRLFYAIDGVNWWVNVDFTKIDLSNNNLSEKNSYDFKHIPQVKILYLAYNKFTNIPIYIAYLKNLTLLDMSNNRITFIDDNICWKLANLRTLNLSCNRIKYIPCTIRYLRELEELNLSKNELITIPNELTYLKYLKKLDISWNKIQLIEPNIFNELFCLEELYCNNNLLTNIENLNNYTVFDSIINLKILDISNNLFQDFIVFHQIPNLERIYISNNKLRNIFGLNLCKKLTEIDCSDNLIKEFPSEFLSIKNLNKLNISINELNNLPTGICLMNNLNELNISGNPMKDASSLKYATTYEIKQFLLYKLNEKDMYFMPDDLKKYYLSKISNENNSKKKSTFPYIRSSIFNFLKKNTELVITNADLREIPFDMIKYNIRENFLTAIDFSGNLIEKGLENFRSILHLLRNVKSLNFSKNNIRYFPTILLSLPLLEELYLSRNLLAIFPGKYMAQDFSINITQSLLILDLSHNQVDEFPIIIQFFKKLKFLDLSHNNIKNLDCLMHTRLEDLEEFYIDNNKIYEIPQNALFRAIPNIQTFTISNNYLTDIPTDLSLLIFLENINFYGNYITKIPYEYLLSADKLKNYLKRYHVYSDEQRYFEVKQEEKLRSDYFILKGKMFKTSPNYYSSRNHYNMRYNYNYNDNYNLNKSLLNSTNYNQKRKYFLKQKSDTYNEDLRNKSFNGIYDKYIFKKNLADINSEIRSVEKIMKNKRLQPHIKANLRKEFLGLIQERADLYK